MITRRPDVILGPHHVVWYGIIDDAAVEARFSGTSWRVSSYQPISNKGILKTTAYLDYPKTTNIRVVVKQGLAMIEAWGGDEEICNELPPWTTACYKR